MSAEAVISSDAEVQKGESARMASFVGAIAIADLVKTTLGPKGMDKILQSVSDRQNSTITITNDGATILKSIPVENPAAKVLVEIAKTQDDTVGDGTTSVTVLCGELLREAEYLINAHIHPMTIVQGWRQAVKIARAALESAAMDHSADPAAFEEDLMNIARTTLSSKLLNVEKDHFARLAVDAILRLKGSGNLDHIQLIKKPGGSLADSFLADGFVMNKSFGIGQPKRLENAKILIANTPMDTDKIKIYGSRVRVDSMMKVAEIEEAEKQKMKKKCQKIIDHGISCFVNRQLIYNYPEQIFTDAGVLSIEHADFDGIERLAAVTGGEIASTFDHPELVALGTCALIDEIIIGEDKLIRFSGCKSGAACSIILRGASSHLLDEAERSLHDALCVLSETVKETRVVCGGGCMEMLMAEAIDAQLHQLATEEAAVATLKSAAAIGKAQLAMAAFARALRQLPTILADNGGYDSTELVAQLKLQHAAGNTKSGLNLFTGEVADMWTLGVRESYKSKLQVLVSAAEAAEMILRVDDIIKAAPRQRQQHA
jgi:T-complex protein 1 subunit beta